MSKSPRVWLITGSSSGLGLEMTRRVLEHGDIAVATLRKPEAIKDLAAQYPADRLLILKVDVTIHQDILDAFKKTKEVFGRLDVVVNNAGYAVLGEVEGTPDDVARAMFEVNFWGSTHVAQEAVRFFREDNKPGKGGHIINISSGAGIAGYPSVGFYSASKHAMEGLAEGLAKELDPAWNIKVTIVPLGAFGTNATGAMIKLPPHPAYDKPDLVVVKTRKAILSRLTGKTDPLLGVEGDTAKAAEALYRLSEVASPPLRLVLGKDAVGLAREKTTSFSAEVEEYVAWSNGLYKE